LVLEEERATHLQQAASLQEEADSLVRDREPGDVQFDDEGGEGDNIAVERDFDLVRSRQALAVVEEIDAALDRVARGVYGICEVSGQRIPKERLQAIPWARERVEFRVNRLR
jgi:RNA polymerase-binding transcription factor DksA